MLCGLFPCSYKCMNLGTGSGRVNGALEEKRKKRKEGGGKEGRREGKEGGGGEKGKREGRERERKKGEWNVEKKGRKRKRKGGG